MITWRRALTVAGLLLLVAWLVSGCNAAVALPTFAPTLTASPAANAPPTRTALPPTASATLTAAPATATPSPSLTEAPTATASRTDLPATATNTPTATPTHTPTATPPALTGALIISVDGLRPDAIQLADTPNLDRLITRGAVSWAASTILPSATLPGHTSMLSGSSPDVHGVRWNVYDPARGYVPTPTLFSVAHDAGLTTAMFVGKSKLEHIAVPGTVDTFAYLIGDDLYLAGQAADHLRQVSPDVLFVHLPGVDGAGHAHGWLSATQLDAVTRADAAIGFLLEVLNEVGRGENTLIIVTADHGGMDKAHGGSDPESMTIPWIIAGPGIRSGYEIASEVMVYDTAVTAAWALGLPLPNEWEGRPVEEAFAP